MKGILLDLYCGNYSAISKPIPKDSAYSKALQTLCDLEDKLSECMNDAQKEVFKRYLNAQAEANDEGCSLYFIEGCKLGAQFMLEVLCTEPDE